MCGACGKELRKDPVLGPERTLRKHMIVAATINRVCQDQRGAPKVTALADGWLVLGASGTSTLCHTVDQVWATVQRLLPAAGVLPTLLTETSFPLHTTGEEGLQQRTLLAGARHFTVTVS